MRIACVLALAACGSSTNSALPPPKLVVGSDRRIELMSILFRLGNRPRYAEAQTPYARAVDATFDKTQRAVVYTSQLAAGYEMAPALAVHLDDQLAPRVAFDPLPPPLARWKVAKLDMYLAAVREFQGLDAFLASQRDYIARVEAADKAMFDTVPFVEWFDTAFGARPRTRYHLVPGLLTGPMDHATHVELPDGSEEIYVIAHLDHPDAAGVPVPTAAALPFVAHELCHSYTNSIVDGAEAELTTAAAPAIAKVQGKMAAQAYPTDTIVVQESIVRATVVLWLRDRGGAAAGDAEIAAQERLGFTWTRALADALQRARGTGTLTPAAVIAATRDVFAHAR